MYDTLSMILVSCLRSLSVNADFKRMLLIASALREIARTVFWYFDNL